MSDSGETVVVAVRVRPFNDREKERNAQLIVNMPDGKSTSISDPNAPNEEPKWFTFDYSYWSHDGYKEEKNGYLTAASHSNYADQKQVFENLGKGVLDNAWNGYNCSLFAYGQTGSGKSYSIVGTKKNKGIIPLVCEELFNRIESTKSKDVEFQVSISMLEIYCERVRDLLSSKAPPKGGLKVREHPKQGFYVEDLTTTPVNSYKEIEKKVNEGTKNRTIAATNMNATSSRAHTIVKILFIQKIPKGGGGTTTKSSEINLVDLAGSERQKDAGSEGDRLKEGIVINKSLSTLGRVIKALHEQQSAKKKTNVQVPYRDSVLTSLLKNALGGNSKTIMIAAISPADINYEESLSTLRFADRVKSIKTKAVVNETATERMIRELKEENARLQELIRRGGVNGSAVNNEEMDNLKRQLEENQKEMENLEQTWQQRLAEERKKRDSISEDKSEIDKKKKDIPHLWNLNEDPALTDMIVHFIAQGENIVGNGNVTTPQILLKGMSIQPEHACITNKDNKTITIIPYSGAEILVNGHPINQATELQQNDRILFGGNHLYVFTNPKKKGIKTSEQITYDLAQKEIAKTHGISAVGNGKQSAADLILEEDLIKILPNVYRANSMAKELKKPVKFEIILNAPEARGLSEGLTEIFIKVYNTAEDTTFMWDKNRFTNRYYGMQEMYQNYVDGDAEYNLPPERDPFYEPPDSSIILGHATMFLQSLAYMVEAEEQLPIVDFNGTDLGQLSVSLVPCSSSGKEIMGEYLETPNELLNKNLGIKIKILAAMGLPRRIDKSWCTYRFFNNEEASTNKQTGHNPNYSHENVISFKPVTKDLISYLINGVLTFTVWATQKIKEGRPIGAAGIATVNKTRKSSQPPTSSSNPQEPIKRPSKKKKPKTSETNGSENSTLKPKRKSGTIIKDQDPKRFIHGPNKRKQARRPGKIQNTHMGDILEKVLNKLYQFTAHIRDQFWNKFAHDYLNQLREANTHFHKQSKFTEILPKPGSVVLVEEDNIPLNGWKLGVIVALNESEDNCVQTAKVKVPSGRILNRPLCQLYPLEVQVNDPATIQKTPAESESTNDNSTPSESIQPRYNFRPRQKVSKTFFVLALCACLLPGNDNHICTDTCKCPAWADDCSFYESSLSEVEKKSLLHLINDDAPHENDAIVHIIQFPDGSDHIIRQLNLIKEDALDDIICFGSGQTFNGPPNFCANRTCDSNASKLCLIQHHELVFAAVHNGKIPIKAWKTLERPPKIPTFHPQPQLPASCEDGKIFLNNTENIRRVQVQSGNSYTVFIPNSTNLIMELPTALVTASREFKLTYWNKHESYNITDVICPTIDYCTQIKPCWFCTAELLNPECRPVKSILMISNLISLLYIILHKLCKKRRRNRRKSSSLPLFIKRKNSDENIFVRFRKLSTGAVLPTISICIICIILLPSIEADGEDLSLTAKSQECTVNSHGFASCKISEVTQLTISTAKTSTLLINYEGRPLGSIKIIPEVHLTCQKMTQHYTRIVDIKTASLKICGGRSLCSGNECAMATSDLRVPAFGTANNLPGNTFCHESCGGWFCKCVTWGEACLYFRNYASPADPRTIEVFSCDGFHTTLILNVTITTQQSSTNRLLTLQEGHSAEINKIKISALDINPEDSPPPQHSLYLNTGKTIAVLNYVGASAANLLQSSDIAAATEFKNCTLQQACKCHPADGIASCSCLENTVLLKLLNDNALPILQNKHWLRPTEDNNVIVDIPAHPRIQISIKEFSLFAAIDMNSCSATVHKIEGCSSCLEGAIADITCTTDFGQAEGHVVCSDMSFPLQCHKSGYFQKVTLFFNKVNVDEECELRCPSKVAKINFHATLKKSTFVNPWSKIVADVQSEPPLITAIIEAVSHFVQSSYTYMPITLGIAAVVALLLLKFLI
uniref:Kinesin-like protein unc-104 n=1 Tax=Panagrolaimus sp. PS1159 TaxID=55785 RepID=A0AC35FQ69_9BILA